MLQSKSKWNFTYKQQAAMSEELEALKVSPLIKGMLAKRDMSTKAKAEAFLNPDLKHLHDPSLLNDMEKTKIRIDLAIDQGESILVFGDYDADGVSATAVLIAALRELGAMCDYYIPNRFTEGYGPNEQAFRDAKNQGFDLIITVDTGIAAIEPAAVAKEIGIDLIITDHHEAQESLPEAYAIVHPKCSEDYPFKELAGVGVAFKLAEYLLGYFPTQLLDLVVIGTIADLVPLVDENRILVYHGLKAISQSNRPGIQALKQICSIQDDITEEDIGFLIGPRINAVGRLQTAYPAVELLLTEDQEEALEIATQINELNQERQQIVKEIAKEAIQMVEATPNENRNVIVVAKEGWNQGVLGIVASKLVRRYQRPAIVLTIQPEEGSAKGSARSIQAFNLFENGMRIKDQFLRFGGHSQAAGMTLLQENVDTIRNSLNQLAEEQLQAEDYKEQFEIEDTIEINSIDLALINELNKIAPFGMGNPKPLFHVKAKPVELRQIGSDQNHLKVLFRSDTAQLAGIGFGMGELYPSISEHIEIETVGYLQINEWNGKKSPQLMIQDIAVNEWQLFDYRGSKLWSKKLEHLDDDQTLTLSFATKEAAQKVVGTFSTFAELNKRVEKQNVADFKNLILLDLPNQLAQLEEVFTILSPLNIFACFHIEEEHFLQSFPTREDFKWFYGMLVKRGQFNTKNEMDMLSRSKSWKINKIEFIIKVFSELEFVKITDDLIYPNKQVEKRDLTESNAYQQSIRQAEMEKVLYYSSYRELKTWMDSQMEQDSSIEEEERYEL